MMTTINDINRYKSITVNPLLSPDQLFELYSVPSFDNQYPEVVAGKEIGSTKVAVQDNDVLICKINPRINRVWVVKHNTPYPLIASSEWIVVRSPENDSNYLKWYFSSPQFKNLMVSQVTGIGGSLTRAQPKQVATYPVPLPDLPTQRRIADKLDKVAEGIVLCRRMIGELDLMVKAKFVEMFGDLSSPECQWKKCHLIEVCANKDDIKCGPFGTQLNKEEYLPEGVAVWEIPQINSQFAKKPTHFLTEQKAEQLSAYSLLPGDIAMSRKGNVGKCAIFPSCFAPGIIHSDVLRIRVDSAKVNPIFMMSQLHYSGAVTRQIEIVSSGAIMAGINVTKLKQIIVHVPPYAIQNRFAAFVTEIDKSKLTIQKILDKMEMEKLALMQEYFG